MADKQAAQGSILKTDHDDDNNFDSMTLVRAIDPPARDRERIEGKDLGDTFDTSILGIENINEPTFNQFWHPGDSEHEKIDTLFDSKAQFGVQLVTSHSTPVTIEYDAKVVNVSPEPVEVGGVYGRVVTVQRVGAITVT